MDDLIKTIVIRDNPLNDELRIRCQEIDKIKRLSLKERRDKYEELALLLNDLLKNKNSNFKECCKSLMTQQLFATVEIASVLDNETEHYIDEIFEILTNKLKED